MTYDEGDVSQQHEGPRASDEIGIRPMSVEDLDQVIEINNAEVPYVTTLDWTSANSILSMSSVPLVVVGENETIVAFCLILGPGTTYKSANYRWVSERFERFAYLDRVCVAPTARRRGIARALYGEAVRRLSQDSTAPASLVLEVNSRPANVESLAFHRSLGFAEIGRAEPYGDGTEVVYLELPIVP